MHGTLHLATIDTVNLLQPRKCCYDRCKVNLVTSNGDIAFHFNPRLNENVAVRNTVIGGTFQTEERDQESFPFAAGQQFTVVITVNSDNYVVS